MSKLARRTTCGGNSTWAIIDRLDDLNTYVNWKTPYYFAAEPNTDPPDPYLPIVVPHGLSSMNSRDVMSWQVRVTLEVMLDLVETTRAVQPSYFELFRKVIPMSDGAVPSAHCYISGSPAPLGVAVDLEGVEGGLRSDPGERVAKGRRRAA